MMGLLKEERVLLSYWEKGLPNHIHLIALETKALSNEKGYVVLSYEFDGWDEYADELKKKQDTVF